MAFLPFLFAVPIGAIAQILLEKGPRTPERVLAAFLTWLNGVPGLMGVYAFLGHTIKADEVAESIGWPAGNPFQTEVAFANLSLGVLGLLGAWRRGNFWVAAAVARAIFLLGASLVHIKELLQKGNCNPGNCGWVFVLDIVFPITDLGLLIGYQRLKRGERSSG
jgi:hypothetical protein